MAARKRSSTQAKKPTLARRAPTPRGVASTPKPHGKARPPSASLLTELDRPGYLRQLVRAIPNFPRPGIVFRDITPLLADPKGLHIVVDSFAERLIGEPVDAVVAIESRGFIFGGALASRLNASFVPVRKPGKLPAKTDKVAYSLEYGQNELEIHRDSLRRGERVVIVDDLLATGGTAAAAAELVRRRGAELMAFLFVIELSALDGRAPLGEVPVISLLQYD